MSEWIQTSLSTIADIIPGFAFKSIHFGDEGYPVIKITDIRPPYVDIANANKVDVSKYGTKRLEKYLISKGDFILAMTGATIGKVGKVIENKTAYVNQRVAIIKPKNDVDKRFVYYCLQNNDFQNFIQNNIDSNSAQENISGTSIGRYEIMLPPIHEQKAIAGVLSSLDDKIDLLHRQNKTLEAMAETLFRQWFIEEAEDEWEEGCLGDIIEIFDSKRIPLSKMERDLKKTGTLYPYYGAAKLMDYINDYIFDGEYILLAEDGSVRTDDGYPVLQYVIGKFWVNNHAHIIKAKPPYNNFLLLNILRNTRANCKMGFPEPHNA
jgi:type I restriction enzyme S subunit